MSPGGIAAIRDAMGAGERTAAEVAAELSAAIAADDATDRPLHAFLAHDPDALVEAAAHAGDTQAGDGSGRGSTASDGSRRLSGVPIAIKDNLVTLDYPTTCGSRLLEGWRSPYEATVVRRLRAAGGLVAGKTNLDEFAMGSSTEHSAFGPTRNPRDRDRVPGGSSGGSAAAVAAGWVAAALGSDTGGSVRQPAAFCGVVGLKPTYGRVSRYGLVAFASSLDQVGTFGRSVEDAALLLEVIAGHDPRDATSANRLAPELVPQLGKGVEGLVVGLPHEYLDADGLDPSVRARVTAAAEALEGAGAELREVSLLHTHLALPAYYIIAPAEASSNLARYDGVRYGVRAPTGAGHTGSFEAMVRETRAAFGDEVKRRILLGTFALSEGYHDEYYGRAQDARRLVAGDFRAAFDSGVDVLLTPTTPTPAFRFGEKTEDPYAMYRSDLFTATASLAGLPAISVPAGTVDGLPVGAQLIADAWAEPTLVRAAGALEVAL